MKVLIKALIALLVIHTAGAWAAPKTADDAEKIMINSDAFHFNNQTGVANYTGNVVVEQGSRRLTGESLEIYRSEKTGDIERIIVHGAPAHYQGLTDPNKPLLYAQAQMITYETEAQFLILEGHAQVTQDGDIYRAARIEYDAIKDTVYSPPSSEQQTTIILKGNQDAPI